jgi:hypothetical protein
VQNCARPQVANRRNKVIFGLSDPGIEVAFRLAVNPPQEMDCPECATQVAPMSGSTWAIAWYSCGRCGTFWYARLRVGPGSDALASRPMLASPHKASTNLRLSGSGEQAWTIEELEAEADALRRKRLPAER